MKVAHVRLGNTALYVPSSDGICGREGGGDLFYVHHSPRDRDRQTLVFHFFLVTREIAKPNGKLWIDYLLD